MSVLLIEKINHRFKRLTKSRQASGLSVCLKMISDAVDGISRLEVDNITHIEMAIQRFKPRKVILQTFWVSEGELLRLKSLFPKVQFYIHLHSNIPFLSVEGYAFEKINEAKRHEVGVIFNDPRAADALNCIHLPNIYSVPFRNIKPPSDKETLDIICAGSLRPMKNQVTQAIAAIKYANNLGKKLRFHMNIERSEGGTETLMNLKSLFRMNLGHELISIPWMEHSNFIDYLENMDMGLQVSMSESFNIVAADYTCAGIPMVVSSEIKWAADSVKSPCAGNAGLISEIMGMAEHWVGTNRAGLRHSSYHAKETWNEFVKA